MIYGNSNIYIYGCEQVSIGSLKGLKPQFSSLQEVASNTLTSSLEDFWLAAGKGYTPLLSEEHLKELLRDHLPGAREADPNWERPPRRDRDGRACSQCAVPELRTSRKQLIHVIDVYISSEKRIAT